MKTYSVLFAQDVSHYATAEINAACADEAIVKARSYPNSRIICRTVKLLWPASISSSTRSAMHVLE